MKRATLINVLGVSADPTTSEIRLARRRAASIFHPDAGGNATLQMAEINAASDQWLADIRAFRDLPQASHEANATRPTGSALDEAATHQAQQRRTSWSLATATLLAVAACFAGLFVAVLELSVYAVAAGGLFGAGVAGLVIAT